MSNLLNIFPNLVCFILLFKYFVLVERSQTENCVLIILTLDARNDCNNVAILNICVKENSQTKFLSCNKDFEQKLPPLNQKLKKVNKKLRICAKSRKNVFIFWHTFSYLILLVSLSRNDNVCK